MHMHNMCSTARTMYTACDVYSFPHLVCSVQSFECFPAPFQRLLAGSAPVRLVVMRAARLQARAVVMYPHGWEWHCVHTVENKHT